METVVLSPGAEAQFPEIRGAMLSAGLAVRVGEAGSDLALRAPGGRMAYVRRGQGSALRLDPCECQMEIAPGDEQMAGALAAELMRGDGGPVLADPISRELYAIAERAALHDVNILISGPSGTGKEVLSRFVHARSGRRGDFVAVNCAALPEAMLEALLFGHERGSFTGAAGASKGLFRAAEGGTLLLDEIGELPLGLQSKLLRVLQEREVLPLGASKSEKIDVRMIAATNRDLGDEVAAGRFRSDLYYRLNVFPLAAAPLAARTGDILPLVAGLLIRHGTARGHVAWPSPAALAMLRQYGWPGNVRELENVLQRAIVLADNRRIEPRDIRFDRPAALATEVANSEPRLNDIVRSHEFEAIDAALASCGGRRIETARKLGISERTLRYKLAEMAQVRGGRQAGTVLQ